MTSIINFLLKKKGRERRNGKEWRRKERKGGGGKGEGCKSGGGME